MGLAWLIQTLGLEDKRKSLWDTPGFCQLLSDLELAETAQTRVPLTFASADFTDLQSCLVISSWLFDRTIKRPTVSFSERFKCRIIIQVYFQLQVLSSSMQRIGNDFKIWTSAD